MLTRVDQILLRVSVGALTLGVAVPLVVTPEIFFPFISGKNFAFRILIEIATLSWIVLALRCPLFRPRRSALMWSVAAFIAALALSLAFAEDPYRSFWSNLERMEGFVGMAHFVLAFLVAGSIFRIADWRRFALGSLCVNVVIIVYALLQFFGIFTISQGGVRVDASFGNAIYLGVYALFHLFFSAYAVYTAAREGRHRAVIGFFATLAFGNIALISLSATRGVVLGLFVGAVVACILLVCSRTASRNIRRIGMAGIVCAIVAVGAFFALRETPLRSHPVFGRILSASLASDDTQARFTIWRMALKGFAERPITGWGQEGFIFPFHTHYDPSLYGREAWFDRAHNAYLDWLVAAGILGFLGYAALWLCAARMVWRFPYGERALWFGFGAAYGVNNLFVFDNGVSHFFFFMLLAYLYYRSTENQRVESGTIYSVRAVVPVACILLVASLYYLNVRPAYAGALLIDALHARPGGLSENLVLFRSALAQNTLATTEIREQLAQAATRVAPLDQVSREIKEEFFFLAAGELEKEIMRRPRDARYYAQLGSLLDAYGLSNEAFAVWMRAVEASPRKQALLFQAGVNRFNAGAMGDAAALFERAYMLHTENREALILLAAMAVYTGDRAREAELLSLPLYIEGVLTDLRLMNAYERVGRIDDALSLWRQQLERDPSDDYVRNRIEELSGT